MCQIFSALIISWGKSSDVLYKYTCSKCKLSYIGHTAKYWEKRLEEHTQISTRTGKLLLTLTVLGTPKGPQLKMAKRLTQFCRRWLGRWLFRLDNEGWTSPYLFSIPKTWIINQALTRLEKSMSSGNSDDVTNLGDNRVNRVKKLIIPVSCHRSRIPTCSKNVPLSPAYQFNCI